jgi:citrate synthase
MSAAVAALSGPLHGGAPARALGMVEAVERSGDLLALRREGRRLEMVLHIDHDRRSNALNDVASLDEVEEARWER